MTTADTTLFAHKTIASKGYVLTFDGNQKITAYNGSFEEPAANAFSIVQAQDCPFRTPTCEDSCYIHNLEKFQPELHKLYKRNSSEIRALLETRFRYEVAYDVADWITENAKGGFRWHVSGDVFSDSYAEWIADVVSWSPTVQHWIYSRSFPFLGPLLHIDNLTVNVSADKDNYWLARRFADEYKLRVCYLTVEGEVPDDLKEGDIIFPDYGLRGVGQKPFEFRNDSEWWQNLKGEHKKMVCPVDLYGKSEKVRCGVCTKCIE